jgi:predicted Zn finger-like uncharacterized protein
MSPVTRCPACGTAFRITPAQLAARSGQARCGRCGNAFDARAALVPDRGAPAEAAVGNADGRRREHFNDAPPGSLPGSDTGWRAGSKSGAPPPRRSSWTWGVAGAAALAALGAQFVFHFRGEMALLWPAARPVLERVCAELGCDLPLPRHAELMSIEASDLQADGSSPGIMVLSATLRNRAAFPQQFPSLELTLTDAQDQALARRVLTAPDYLGRGANLEGGFAANSEFAVKVFMEAAALKPTGYRLYLFYP